ncbi:MAG: hypothetical protein QMC17_04990, partial [Paracoccaceae bacterium]
LRPWWEVVLSISLGIVGLWFLCLGGLILGPLGGVASSLAAFWLLLALRRMKFVTLGQGEGVVEVVEGQVTYFSPEAGGVIRLQDLIEIRITLRAGQRYWRLMQDDDDTLYIPLAALGAERLFDAFTSLPGLDSIMLVRALNEKFKGEGTAKIFKDPSAQGFNLASSSGGFILGSVVWKKDRKGLLPFVKP